MMWFISAIALLALGSAHADDCCSDICFLVDASSSINRLNWNGFVRPFLGEVVVGLHPHLDFNIAIQTFSDKDVSEELTLINYWNNAQLVDDTIANLVYLRGNTDITTGIEQCRALLNVPNNRPECPDLIVLVSDGVPTKRGPETIPAADAAKADGIYIICVGVGEFSDVLLKAISSDDKVISVENFADLSTVVPDTISSIKWHSHCHDPTTTKPHFCPTCDGTYIPKPTYEFGYAAPIPLVWHPISAFNPPEPGDEPPEDLFAWEQYILSGSSYTYYTDNEIPTTHSK
jgi:hypothetical protein